MRCRILSLSVSALTLLLATTVYGQGRCQGGGHASMMGGYGQGGYGPNYGNQGGYGAPGTNNQYAGPNANSAGSATSPATAQAIDAEGTIDSVTGNKIRITTNYNRPMIVTVQGTKTQVHVVGSASAEFLKPGTNVEFVAQLDKDGTAAGTISQLAVFSSARSKPSGLFSAATFATKPSDPGIAANQTAFTASAHKSHARLADSDDSLMQSASTKIQLPAECIVRGQIKSNHAGNLVISTGSGASIKARLAAEPQIDVDVSTYSMAVKGDRITVQGTGSQGGGLRNSNPGTVNAQSVRIEVADVMTGGKGRGSQAGGRAQISDRAVANASE